MSQTQILLENRISEQSKWLAPFVVLLLVKLCVENFVSVAVLTITTFSLQRLNAIFKEQLSLKDKSSQRTLFGLLFLEFSILTSTTLFPNILLYSDSILDRMILSFSINRTLNFLDILWRCLITDMLIRHIILTLKLLICVSVKPKTILLTKLARNPAKLIVTICCSKIHSWCNGRQEYTDSDHSEQNSGDAEMGLSTTTLETDTEQFPAESAQNYLIRRQSPSQLFIDTMATTTSTAPISEPLPPSTTHSALSLSYDFCCCSRKGRADKDDDNENTLTNANGDYLVRIRICWLIDMWTTCYRALLPIPMWTHYFGVSNVIYFGLLLQLSYILFKIVDVCWKAKGALEATDMFFTDKLEYGRYYSASSETSNSSNTNLNNIECPICFDNLLEKAAGNENKLIVALDCQHLFCEICIAEWLDKEHSCPVCRATVTSKGSAALCALRDATSQPSII